MWYPNRAQWWVIWGVYVAALLVSVDWTYSTTEMRAPTTDESIQEKLAEAEVNLASPLEKIDLQNELSRLRSKRRVSVERFEPSLDTAALVTFLVIGGGLTIWRLQRKAT